MIMLSRDRFDTMYCIQGLLKSCNVLCLSILSEFRLQSFIIRLFDPPSLRPYNVLTSLLTRLLDFGMNCASVCAEVQKLAVSVHVGRRKRNLYTDYNLFCCCSALFSQSTSKREAEERLEEKITKLKDTFKKHGTSFSWQVLRVLPVVHPHTLTICLIGALANVDKSSLVRILSSGKSEVCNNPFTTRGISMGHFFVTSFAISWC